MTREELKAKIDALIGLESELAEDCYGYTQLYYRSPTGVLLFAVRIADHAGFMVGRGWQFGGQTSAVPELWQKLASIHR